MPLENITENIVNELERLEPFGQGNEKAGYCCKECRNFKSKDFWQNKNVLKLTLNLDNEKQWMAFILETLMNSEKT